MNATGFGHSGFSPSLHAERNDGVRVHKRDYPTGIGGPKLSLEKIAQLIREGMHSKLVMGWAMDQLRSCGLDGRDHNSTAFAKASCLLTAIRQATVYTPDPPMTEFIKSAEAMLCLRPGLCIRGGDCDDQIVLLGSTVSSVGIPVRVIKQTFGAGDQEHVLVEAQGDDGSWFPMDPSTNMPCGQKQQASYEFRMDPNNPSMIGLKGAPEAQFIVIGNPKGFGLAPSGANLPSSVVVSGPYAAASSDLQNQILTPMQAGDIYYNSGEYSSAVASYQAAGAAGATSVGPEIDLAGAANVTQPLTQQAWQINGALAALQGADQTTADLARSEAVQMLSLYQQAMAAGASALAGGGVPSAGSMTLNQAWGLAIGSGLVAGFAWGWWRSNGRRR